MKRKERGRRRPVPPLASGFHERGVKTDSFGSTSFFSPSFSVISPRKKFIRESDPSISLLISLGGGGEGPRKNEVFHLSPF